MHQPFIALKAARMTGGYTLVGVAAEAGCSIGYVRQYEIDPRSLSDEKKRARLDEIYARFPKVAA